MAKENPRKSRYLEEIKKRGRQSRIYRKYQLLGLQIAEILGDQKHKSLYIKLAKEGDAEKLLRIARSIAEKRNVNRKGAYFMAVIKAKKPNRKVHERLDSHYPQ